MGNKLLWYFSEGSDFLFREIRYNVRKRKMCIRDRYMVNSRAYTTDSKGQLKLIIRSKGDFVLKNAEEAAKINKEILATVQVKNNKVTLEKGKTTTFAFSEELDTVSYTHLDVYKRQVLHLLGYDHEQGGLDRVRMREKEEQVMTQLGLPSSSSYVMDEE